MPPLTAYRSAPAGTPADVAAHLSRFGLTLPDLLTDTNPKLTKGATVARSVILHHLPARALAAAITPGHRGVTAPRSYLADLAALADATGTTAAAKRWHGCPWATAGCAAGCLNWAGHGGLSPAVALARGRRTLAMLGNPQIYGRAMLWAIARAWAQAQAQDLPLAVRLRGTDEGPAIGWHRLAVPVTLADAATLSHRYGLMIAPGCHRNLAAALSVPRAEGSLTLYDYSKAPLSGPLGLTAQAASGWDVTASMAADRLTAAADAAAALRAGYRLAVPVALRKGSALPRALEILPHRNFAPLIVPAVDGDATDHRWRDPGAVAVILRTKVSRGADRSLADRFSLAPTPEPQPLADGTVRLIW